MIGKEIVSKGTAQDSPDNKSDVGLSTRSTKLEYGVTLHRKTC